MSPRDGAVIVFARAPVAGTVKTRLIPVLGAEGALALYWRLLRHTLSIADQVGFALHILCVTPDGSDAMFTALADTGRWRITAQGEGDLGVRMQQALRHAFAQCSYAVVIGSDCVDLTASDLGTAAAVLGDTGAGIDVVLGPADDGGYYLIGTRQVIPALFVDIPWGTPQVLADTRARIRALEYACLELPIRHDIDRPADLALVS